MASGASEPANATATPRETHMRELLQVNLHAGLEHHEHQAELPEHDEGIGFGRDLQAVGTHRDAGEDLADELRE